MHVPSRRQPTTIRATNNHGKSRIIPTTVVYAVPIMLLLPFAPL